MLEGIRKRRNSLVILLAFAAIILVFVFWGVGPNTGGDGDQGAVATVDGERITVKEYANLYKRQFDYYKQTFKDQFNDEMAKKLDLKRRSVEILINRSLAIKAAKADGLEVSASEVQDAIKAIPAFSRNGVFDKDAYFQTLSANRLKPAEFEKSVEMDLLTMKMREKVLKDVSVSDEEVMAEYRTVNRKLDLDYIGVSGAAFKKEVSVTDDEAREYLKKNGSEFMVPVKVKAFYAWAGIKEAAGKVKVTDAEIREYYEKNLKQFETPEEARARHILIRPDAKEADKEKARAEARAKAGELLKKLKTGASFAELAKANSEDPGSARLGGELGWFPRGVMVKSFEAAVFSLKKGELSPVVETEFGYHIILLEEKRDAGVVPLNKARESIVESLKGKKSKIDARDAVVSIEKAFKEARTVDELKKAASANKDIKTATTGLFSEDDKKTVLATNESLKNSIFFLRAGDTTQIVDGGDGYYIVRLLEKVDAHVPGYDEIAGDVKEKVASIKANERARQKAEEILSRVKGGEDLKNVAKKENYKVESTGYFSRVDGFIPGIGAYAAENDKLFALNEAAPVYPEILGQDGKFYILRLKGVKEAPEEGIAQMKEELKSRILARKQEEVLSKWLDGLRSKASIQVYENML